MGDDRFRQQEAAEKQEDNWVTKTPEDLLRGPDSANNRERRTKERSDGQWQSFSDPERHDQGHDRQEMMSRKREATQREEPDERKEDRRKPKPSPLPKLLEAFFRQGKPGSHRTWLFLGAADFRKHAEIFERRGVAPNFNARRDLLQQAAHDFSGAGLRQSFRKTDVVRLCDGANFLRHMVAEFIANSGVGLDATLESHERHQRLAFQFIRPADHRSFGHLRIAHESALDFCRADTMTGNVENVIDPADDPEITILILPATVAGEIASGHFGPVDFLVTLGVTP